MVHLELSRSLTAEHPVRVVGEVDSDGRGGCEKIFGLKAVLFSMLKAFKKISVFFCFNRFLLSNLLFVMLVLVSRFLMWMLLWLCFRCLRPWWWPSGACWRIKVGRCGWHQLKSQRKHSKHFPKLERMNVKTSLVFTEHLFLKESCCCFRPEKDMLKILRLGAVPIQTFLACIRICSGISEPFYDGQQKNLN